VSGYVYRGAGRELTPDEVEAMLTGKPRPMDLATSSEARAAVPAPKLIQGIVLPDAPAIEPPPVATSPPAGEPARCDRCGYRLAKCDCAARFGGR
jgi:hypothetical protein